VSRLRILLVEDNPLNRKLARDVLEYRGHEVVEAVDVAQGWAAVQGSVVDVVLLDVQIPGGGGEVLLRRIRGAPEVAALPVVAVTAFAMEGDRERFLAMGFDGYLSKPIETRTFAAKVESFATTRRLRQGEQS
jgi:two-component system cell cycle response regulator DivK